MALIQTGSSTSGYANVDSGFAVGVRPRPLPGNQYAVGWKTTSLAFTTGVNIFSAVNTGASPIAVFRFMAKIKPMAVFTAAAAGLEVTLSAFIGRSWSVVGTTNRTTLSFASNANKLRTSFSAAASLNVGYASAVGGITGDTITQDANPVWMDSGSPQTHSVTAAATPGAGVQNSFECKLDFMTDAADGEYPILLAQNEGIRLVYTLTGTAAALMVVGNMRWAELTAFPEGS